MRIVGFDIGTHSLGTSVRDEEIGNDLKEQLVYYSVDSFNSGIGNGKSGEYSYAAERSGGKRKRILNERRRYRNWETLKLLIEYKMCPLTMEELESWMTYDKARGLFRKYPIDAVHFERWIRLDFNNDGKSDYSSPYQLRRELMSRQFDFTQEIERYKLGRALYHISQRRGFKSSKGETLKEIEQNIGDNDKVEMNSDSTLNELKKSEEKKSGYLVEYMNKHGLKTVGCAFAQLEDEGIRVRNSIYQAVRSQYKDEIYEIFKFQEDLVNEQELLRRLVSEKKGEGTIFYKCPLKSQKGLVGKCTLEPNKPRCPISHPKFEEFRAWCFINNIKYKNSEEDDWRELSLADKEQIYLEIFTSKVRVDFAFKEIRTWIEKRYHVVLRYDENKRTINFKDNLIVSGCPITARFIKLLGPDWDTYKQQGTKERWSHSKNNPVRHTTSYDVYDLWHVCYTSDEDSDILSFARNRLGWDEDKAKQLVRIWTDIREGYAMLSLKAIKNINYFLRKGFVYSDAVMLAKLPDIVGREQWSVRENELLPLVVDVFDSIKHLNKKQKTICNITNRLIANYKSLGLSTGIFAYKDFSYILDEADKQDVLNAVIQHTGERTWNNMCDDERTYIQQEIETNYQSFFSSQKRDYMRMPKLSEQISKALSDVLGDTYHFENLYHHSDISPYAVQYAENISQSLLGSPNIGAIKNPVALRTLQIIRKKVNALIENNIIDPENTRVVIETTRNFNDANMRWAITKYQENREKEHKEIVEALKEFFPNREFSDKDLDKARFFFEQQDDYDKVYSAKRYGKDLKNFVKKYRLWKEQGCVCFYTGRVIKISELFKDDNFEIEHTIPRSISYDNSLANLTVCDTHYNRAIKRNLLPTQLPNYEKDVTINGREYKAILPQLRRWENLVERLKDNVVAWKARSRKAIDKSRKDDCIRQIHLWQMELDYWNAKLQHFKQIEVSNGFRNRQLVDTGLITRHTAIYLKSLFKNVDVQKGEVTAVFRKIFGIQQETEQKNRDLLSHHAIDATVLTLIPVAAKRERMLKLYYQKEESIGNEKEYYANELRNEIADCHIGGGIERVVSFIESHILINYHSTDKTLIPAKKVIRKRGKIVQFKHKDGSIHSHISTGDSIRASLHKESFYGAIKYPVTDENGMPKRDARGFVYDNSEPMIVMRIPVKDIKEGDADKIIIDPYVRKSICRIIDQRMAEGLSYKEAINGDFWMLDKNGDEIKYSKNGRRLCPIRHARCKVKAGRGYMTYATSLSIKEQVYFSTKKLINITDRSYKKNVYAQNDDNYILLFYEGIKKGIVVRKSRIVNYLEIATLRQEKLSDGTYRIKKIEDLLNEPYYNKIEEKGISYNLSAVIKVGLRLLKWNNTPEELYHISQDELSKRLFVVKKFNSVGSDRLYLKSHIDGSNDDKFISLGVTGLNYMIEGRDFEIDELGNIHFKD